MKFIPTLICCLFWMLLNDGSLESWLLGVPAVICSVWFFFRRDISDDTRLQPAVLLHFLPWFLWESFRGGIEVSKLALSRQGIQSSEIFDFQCRLQNARAEVFFVNCINMLPGTATIDWTKDRIKIHTLSSVEKSRREIVDVQRRIAALFALQLPEDRTESQSIPESIEGDSTRRLKPS